VIPAIGDVEVAGGVEREAARVAKAGGRAGAVSNTKRTKALNYVLLFLLLLLPFFFFPPVATIKSFQMG
jgi:hypothetical protein